MLIASTSRRNPTESPRPSSSARAEKDVLGQAAASEADAGVEETAADACVVADRVGELRDIRPGDLGDLGHGVDEADLGGEERVGGDLDEFGRGVIGDDPRGAGVERGAVDGVELFDRLLVGDAVHEAVGCDGVLHREALAEELGVPREPCVRGGLGEARGEACRGADRHGALADDEGALGEVRREPVERGVDVPHVGGVGTGRLRGAHGDEVDFGTRGIRQVGAEPQPARCGRRPQDLGKAGLEERRAPRGELGDLAFVDVDADDVVTEFRHRGGVHGAEVAASDHRYLHGCLPIDRVRGEQFLGERDRRRVSRRRPAWSPWSG
jgi:hypothetical protein